MPLRKWTIEEKNKLKYLYLKTNTPIEEICRILQRTPQAIQHRLKLTGIKKKRFYSIVKHPTRITPSLARIHAHICGDGCSYKLREKDCYGPWAKYRKNPYRIRYIVCYTNTNKNLLDEFRQDINQTFGIRGKKLRDFDIRINSKRIWQLLIKEMGAGNSYKWRIPKEITEGPREVKKNWIRAFFDDEAYFDHGNRIRVKCVNKKGLQQITKMLNEFVPCHLLPKKGSYWGKTFCINVNKKDAPKFFSEIGSLRYQPDEKI